MSYQSSSGFNRSHSQGSSQGSSQGDSQGGSQGTNNSASFVPDYEPQLGFLEQFGNLSGRLGQQQYDWAHNEFDNNSRLTNQNVNNYLQQHDMASQAAQRDYANYNDTYNPAISSLGQDWQSYTSPDRVASEMGRAEGDVAQNFEGQRKNIEQNLQSFGVNPSDPRYAGAMAANRTAQGASEAGAGTQARLNTEATGRALRSQALQEAHLLPGQQATEQNVAMQGVTGAENAAMSNTSLGALTLGTGKDYLNAGISDVKFQPLGNVSAQQNTAYNRSHNSSQNSSNNTSDSFGQNQSQGAHAPSGGGGGGGSRGGGGDRGGNQGGNQGRNGGNDRNADQNDGRGGDDGSGGRNGDGGGANPAIYNRDPGEEDGGDASGDGGGWNDAAPAGGGDPTAGDPSGWDPGNAGDDPGYGSGWGDYATGIPMDQFDEQFAAGGAIPDGMSPSHGQQTDDVPAQISQTGQRAQLNAGEFVIPKQAVEWYGHKFFQELIAKSIKARQANAGPAHPTMHQGVPHAAGGMVVPGTPQWDAAFRANQMGNHARQQNIFHGTHWNPDNPQDQQRAAMSRRPWRNAGGQQRNQNTQNYGGGQQRGRQQSGDDTGGSGGQSYGGGQQQTGNNNPMASPVQPFGIRPAGSSGADPDVRAQGIDDGTAGGNPMMRMGDPNWQAEQQRGRQQLGDDTGGSSGGYGDRQRSRLPTMNNYQNGTARSQFRPQQNYFQRNPLPQNVSNPGWTDVHAPERAPNPAVPTPTNPQPVNSQPEPMPTMSLGGGNPIDQMPTMTLGSGGQQAGVGRGSIGGGRAGVNQMFSTGFLRG